MAPVALQPVASGEWSWAVVDADGVEHALSDSAYRVEFGVSGALMPAVAVRSRELPLAEGDSLQGVRVESRPFDLPISIVDTTMAALVDRHESLLAWLDPTRGPVIIRVTRPDGDQRELVCTYEGGLEGDERPEAGVRTWFRGVASFRAHMPYWRDAADTNVEFAAAESAGTWFGAFTPFLTMLASSSVLAVQNVTNDGSAAAWPVWTIVGPGVSPVLRNLSTGKHLGLDLTMLAGETVLVDATPLVEVPIGNTAGDSLFSHLTAGSTLWALARGTNRIQVEMQGTSGDSLVTLAYRRRWLRR